MPHISKQKIDPKVKKDIERYFISILENAGSNTRVNIFSELLTPTEKIMLAKRIGILCMLRKGVTTYQISKALGVSQSTAERFARDVRANKFKKTSNWAWKQTKEGQLYALLESLVSLAFTGRTKSFKKFIDEY